MKLGQSNIWNIVNPKKVKKKLEKMEKNRQNWSKTRAGGMIILGIDTIKSFKNC